MPACQGTMTELEAAPMSLRTPAHGLDFMAICMCVQMADGYLHCNAMLPQEQLKSQVQEES